jgi:hypothetical protein
MIMQPYSHIKKGKEKEFLGIDFLRPDVVLFFKGGDKNT